MLTEKINEEIKIAMKNGNKLRLETLRAVRAAIIEFEKSGLNRQLNEDDEINILNSQIKKRRDAIEIYEKANRTELAQKEKNELMILMEFLPKQLTEDEIIQNVKEILNEFPNATENDFGKIMGIAVKKLKGKAEGKVIQQIVKKLLSKNE